MTRPVLRLTLAGLFGALAVAWLVPGVRSGDDKPAASPADKLLRPVKFPGIEDPKTTLQEALDNLTKDYGVSFDVNEAAFREEQINDVLSQPIAEKPIPKMTDVRLETVLRKVLFRIPVPSGAAYLVRDVSEIPAILEAARCTEPAEVCPAGPGA